MIKFLCDVCFKEPTEDFLLDGTIFETKFPFDVENVTAQKRLTKRQIHICRVCFDKFLAKHLEIKIKK